MNYGVGDTVVCVDAMSTIKGARTGLVAGQKYTVSGFSSTPCCGVQLVDVDGPRWAAFYICPYCLQRHAAGKYGFSTWRFIKLDGLKEETEERNEQKPGGVT